MMNKNRIFLILEGHFLLVKNGSKVFYGSSAKNGCGRGGSRGPCCHMALPYGFAMPYGFAKILVEDRKSEIFQKKVRSFHQSPLEKRTTLDF